MMVFFAVTLAVLDILSMILNQYAIDEFITNGNFNHLMYLFG